jgi:uncharacterized protein (UPF0548 family)
MDHEGGTSEVERTVSRPRVTPVRQGVHASEVVCLLGRPGLVVCEPGADVHPPIEVARHREGRHACDGDGVNIGGLRLGRLSDGELLELLRRARQGAPTYDHIGSTLDPLRCDAPAVRSFPLDVGRGDATFRAARTALQTWVPQRGLGAEVLPAGLRVALDETVLVVLRRGPIFFVAPNRVVALVDEPRRFAFAYGTLPGHPERGEESFTVEWLSDDTVRATIRVQARPATLAARVAGPLGGWLQRAALRRYLRAITEHVTSENDRGTN